MRNKWLGNTFYLPWKSMRFCEFEWHSLKHDEILWGAKNFEFRQVFSSPGGVGDLQSLEGTPRNHPSRMGRVSNRSVSESMKFDQQHVACSTRLRSCPSQNPQLSFKTYLKAHRRIIENTYFCWSQNYSGYAAIPILDFSFHIVNCVRSFHIQCDRLPGERLDEDLHAATEAKDQVERALFLDVVIWKRPTIFQLFASEDQSLLVRRNSFFVLKMCIKNRSTRRSEFIWKLLRKEPII